MLYSEDNYVLNQWMLSNSDKAVTNLCLTANSKTAITLQKCKPGDPTQVMKDELYTSGGVNGQCFLEPSGYVYLHI